ncbi:hypothetical protein HK096_003456, partial [Nowakowskiella sp. JEL0078]
MENPTITTPTFSPIMLPAKFNVIFLGGQATFLQLPISSVLLPVIYLGALIESRFQFTKGSIHVLKVNESNLMANDPRLERLIETRSSGNLNFVHKLFNVSMCDTIIGSIKDVFFEHLSEKNPGISLIVLVPNLQFENEFLRSQSDLEKQQILRYRQASPIMDHESANSTPTSPMGRHEQHYQLLLHQNNMRRQNQETLIIQNDLIKKPNSVNNVRDIQPKTKPLSPQDAIKSTINSPKSHQKKIHKSTIEAPIIKNHKYLFRSRIPTVEPEIEHFSHYISSIEMHSTWKKIKMRRSQQEVYRGIKDAIPEFLNDFQTAIFPLNRNLFHIAAYYNWADVIIRLSKFPDHLANINAEDNFGLSPLHVAARCGNFESVSALFDIVNVTAKTHDLANPLHMAVLSSKPIPIVDFMINANKGLDFNNIAKNDATVIHYAFHGPRTAEILEIFMQHRCTMLSELSQLGENLLLSAAGAGSPAGVQFLLSQNFPLEVRNSAGSFALHLASASKRDTAPQCIEILVKNYMPVDIMDADGLTPLAISVLEGIVENMKALLKFKANPCIILGSNSEQQVDISESSVESKWYGLPISHLAVVENIPLDLIGLLIAEDGVLTTVDLKNGYTLLHMAVVHRQYKIIQKIYEEMKNLSPNLIPKLLEAKDKLNYTPLQLAVINEFENEIRALLKMGSSLSSKLDVVNLDESHVQMNIIDFANLKAKSSSLKVMKEFAIATEDESDDLEESPSKQSAPFSRKVSPKFATTSGSFHKSNITSDSETDELQQQTNSEDISEDDMEVDTTEQDTYPWHTENPYVDTTYSLPKIESDIKYPIDYMKLIKKKSLAKKKEIFDVKKKELSDVRRLPLCKLCKLPRTREYHFIERRGVFHCLDTKIEPPPHARADVEKERLERQIKQEIQLQMEKRKFSETTAINHGSSPISAAPIMASTQHNLPLEAIRTISLETKQINVP